MTTKEAFTKRYNIVRDGVCAALDLALTRAIGNNALDFDGMADNFADVYPLIAAVLQRELHSILEGSSYDHTRRSQKLQATKYRRDYRIWTNYAGDYTTKH